MSRIDKAMEVLAAQQGKAATPGPETSTSPASGPFGLDDYNRETSSPLPVGGAPAAPSPAKGAGLDSAAAPPAFAFEKAGVDVTPENPNGAGTRLRLSAEVGARLVTEGAGMVPLEQYRRLSAVLHDIQLQQGLKTLMVTSAVPSEGKTLTVVNLGLTLSESYNRRVLIVDADLRWPSIHKILKLPNGVGLSEALRGQPSELPIRHLSARLAVLTAGRPGAAPLAGLTSTRMGTLIEECSREFDWVILDTPPVGLLPDAQLLARLTRAVVFVIAAGATPAATVERAVAELGPECIIGTVLNRVDARRIPAAEYYSYYETGADDSSPSLSALLKD